MATNLWDGTTVTAFNTLNVSLNARQAKLYQLGPRALAKLTATTLTGKGGLVLAGSGGIPNWPYLVLASTNFALPLTNWAIVSSNVFDGNGDLFVTNEPAPSTSREFYRLELQ
jgi:hypothetical protein